jgi:hypothetical protein
VGYRARRRYYGSKEVACRRFAEVDLDIVKPISLW